MTIKQHKLTIDKTSKHPLNSPIIYVLKNDNEVYIGETTNLVNRFKSHHKVTEGNFNLYDEMRCFENKKYNLSITKDIENKLIVAARTTINKTKISNSNNGYAKHRYPSEQELIATDDTSQIWNDLFKDEWHLTNYGYNELLNKDILKLSPYHQLNDEQQLIKEELLFIIKEALYKNEKTLINIYGNAGTGKSVLLSCIFNEINSLCKTKNIDNNLFENKKPYFLCNHRELQKKLHKFSKRKKH